MKILCPFHDDHTPSMTVYGEWSHCHVCRANVKTAELNLKDTPGPLRPYKEPENVEKKINYIDSLPAKEIRGFELPFDQQGYYLVWPDRSFWKRRNWDGKQRYTGPSGVRQPLLTLSGKESSLLIAVEGEFNAMTLHKALSGQYTVVSPGPASEFPRYIKEYLGAIRTVLVLDKDAPGIAFGVMVKNLLHEAGKYCTLICVPEDYNDLARDKGIEAVKAAFEGEI